VKRVFAPSPRAEKARLIDISNMSLEISGQTLVEEIFKGQPKLEEQLVKMQQGY
jgi:hypothetical protein